MLFFIVLHAICGEFQTGIPLFADIMQNSTVATGRFGQESSHVLLDSSPYSCGAVKCVQNVILSLSTAVMHLSKLYLQVENLSAKLKCVKLSTVLTGIRRSCLSV